MKAASREDTNLDTANKRPRVSVVTVVLNSRNLVEQTILSVLNQDYEDLEYLILDGESTDGTLDIIERYRSKVDLLLVEKDSGIYDAMNKSARLATGDYIIFMNSGDEFASPLSVSEMCASAPNGETLVCGGWIVKYPWGLERTCWPSPLERAWKGMFVQHQSIMVKTDYMREHPFDLSLRLGADYAFLLGLLAIGEKMAICPSIVSRVSSNGASDNDRVRVLRDHWKHARRFRPAVSTDLYFIKSIAREYLVGVVKSVIPASATRALISRSNR